MPTSLLSTCMGVETQTNRAFAFGSQKCYDGLKGGKVPVLAGRPVVKADLELHVGEKGAEASAGVRVGGVGGGGVGL